MRVWVLMGNDFPEAVFASREEAEQEVAARKKLDEIERQQVRRLSPKIYWRAYEFKLKGSLQDVTQDVTSAKT